MKDMTHATLNQPTVPVQVMKLQARRFATPTKKHRQAEMARRVAKLKWVIHDAPQPRVYHLVVQRSEGPEGPVTAYCLELPGAIAEAGTDEKACERLREAVSLLQEESRESGEELPWVARDPEMGERVVSSITIDG